MAPIAIHLSSISCKGVRNPIPFQKPSIYAVVSIADGGDVADRKRQQKTPVDRTGGENPEWDHPMLLDLGLGGGGDRASLYLRFDLKAQGGLLLVADKLVGVVRVPVTDLEAEGIGGSVRHVSYQVRAPGGKPNGVLSFSYKLRFSYYPERKTEEIRPPPDPAVSLYSRRDTCSSDPVVSSPPPPPLPVGLYPRLDTAISPPPVNVYPPPKPAAYPPPAASWCNDLLPDSSAPSYIAYLPAPDPATWWSAERPIGGEWYPPPPLVHYPPPPPPVTDAAYYYPPPPLGRYHPPPPVTDAACYCPPPHPAFYYPPTAGPYGKPNDGWDSGPLFL